MRYVFFFVGLAMFLVGAASHFPRIPLPFDCRTVACTIASAGFSLDVVLMVAGVFLILISWLIKRLAQ